jgi:hypothetical protein
MSAALSLVGQTFGRLYVIERAGSNKWRAPLWLCRCACGGTVIDTTYSLSNLRKSCGCIREKHGYARHGKHRSPTYHSWSNMIQRCTNPNNTRWEDYGGAGITVCERWLTFENFLADMGERPPNTTLGRFGDVGSYCKENCAWQTRREQNEAANSKRAALAMTAREVPATMAA